MSEYQAPEFKSCTECGAENTTKGTRCTACTVALPTCPNGGSCAENRQEWPLPKLPDVREALPVGTTIWTVVRRVSQSGMSRVISFHYVDKSGEVRWVDMSVAGFKHHKTERGYVLKGCGMDMAFHGVYSLGQALYGDGYAFTQRAL